MLSMGRLLVIPFGVSVGVAAVLALGMLNADTSHLRRELIVLRAPPSAVIRPIHSLAAPIQGLDPSSIESGCDCLVAQVRRDGNTSVLLDIELRVDGQNPNPMVMTAREIGGTGRIPILEVQVNVDRRWRWSGFVVDGDAIEKGRVSILLAQEESLGSFYPGEVYVGGNQVEEARLQWAELSHGEAQQRIVQLDIQGSANSGRSTDEIVLWIQAGPDVQQELVFALPSSS